MGDIASSVIEGELHKRATWAIAKIAAEGRKTLSQSGARSVFDLMVALDDENARLREAIQTTVNDAMAECGGDGQGCKTFRQHYGNVEHRRRKCGSCPMDTMAEIIAALQPEKADD